MKKVVLTILILLLIVSVAGCSNTPEHPVEYSSFQEKFKFDNAEYILIDEEIDRSSFTTLVGYLINAEDLEKWKSIDDDESLIYAIDEENSVYKYAYDENDPLKNRFELFSSEIYEDYLALYHDWDSFTIFKKVQNENNDE